VTICLEFQGQIYDDNNSSKKVFYRQYFSWSMSI